MAYIGVPVKRKEDPRLITGQGQYTGNIVVPNLKHAAFVRSPYAHARIKRIDTSAARQLPGVVLVFTGEELLSAYGPMPMDGAGEGVKIKDGQEKIPHSRYPLSIERVRYAGEPVAVVVAETAASAVDAANLVAVEWEPLPAVGTVESALAPDAPKLFDDMSDNVDRVWKRKRGQPDEAFAEADRVVTATFINQRLAPVPMEGRATLAMPDPTTGGLTMWTSNQVAHDVRSTLAKMFHLPESSVRVIAPDVGGGFGQKFGTFAEDFVLAVLALRHHLAVRWVEGRTEHLLASPHGRAQTAEMSAAVKNDGTITALKLRLTGDVGAYPHMGTGIHIGTGTMIVGPYRIANIDLEVKAVFTNTSPIGAYRGAGRPEATYHIERLINAVAQEMELDPIAVRRKNFIPSDAFPYKSPAGGTYDSGAYEQTLNKALEISRYEALRAEQRQRLADNSPTLLGIGLATYVEVCAFGYDSATVRADPAGGITVFTGISPHGQGQHTTFSQIVADHLGVAFDDIVVKHGDTASTPMGQGTGGSRGLVVGGSALLKAIEVVKQKAFRLAAHILEAAPEDITFTDGRYHVKGVPDKSLTFAQIAERAYTDELPDEIDPGLEATSFFKLVNSTSPFGAHIAVVEVERETGMVRLREYYSVDDCGPRISPHLVVGQIHGGLAQGIAQALLEEMVYGADGQSPSASLMEYALPRASTFPNFTLDQTVTPSPSNPLGVKGIGEAATIGSTPTMVNAVLDALKPLGVHHLDMPLTPEKVWRAIQQTG